MSGSDVDEAAKRARIDAILRPFVMGSSSASDTSMTVRRVAATARDAAASLLPILGAPQRSAHRVRRIIVPVLTCSWAEFDAAYEAALDALIALPPAIPGVEDPPWDVDLTPEPARRRSWVDDGQWRAPPAFASDAVAPGGTVGRVVQRSATSVLITEDGRPVRIHSRCECANAERSARTGIAFEHVQLRRDGSVLDVVMGVACGSCRAPTG